MPIKVWVYNEYTSGFFGLTRIGDWRKIWLRSYYVIEKAKIINDYGAYGTTYRDFKYYTGDYLNKTDAEFTLKQLIEKS
jgi:hypothetical protein